MSERARKMAEQFERTNEDLIAVVESCSDEQWGTLVPEEERTIGILCHHVAERYQFQTQLIEAVSTGVAGPPDDQAAVDAANARHMERYANCTKEEVVALLRRNGAAAKAVVEALTDQRLEHEGRLVLYGDRPVTARDVIEGRLLRHARFHLEGIRRALGGELPTKEATMQP